jgi:hypothetical protein
MYLEPCTVNKLRLLLILQKLESSSFPGLGWSLKWETQLATAAAQLGLLHR